MNYDYYDNVITKPPLNEETLAHYGVKGMHWGVRKNPYINSDGSLNKRGQRKKATLEKRKKRNLNRAKNDIDYDLNRAPFSLNKRYNKAKQNASTAREAAKEVREEANEFKNSGRYSKKQVKSYDKFAKSYEKRAEKAEKKEKKFTQNMKDAHSGNRAYVKTIEDHFDSKIAAIYNPDVKKSDWYKESSKKYSKQLLDDLTIGSGYGRYNRQVEEKNKRKRKNYSTLDQR